MYAPDDSFARAARPLLYHRAMRNKRVKIQDCMIKFMMVSLAAALAACVVDPAAEDQAATEARSHGLTASPADDQPAGTLDQGSEELQQEGDASEEGLTISEDQDEALAERCGESLRNCGNGTTCVVYRHCTGGRDSIRVRAIIRFGADGPCTTVGPNQTKVIWVYGGFSVFDRIDRC